MLRDNPMHNPASVEKASKSLRGRTFLSRGGNGKLTEPQKLLAKMLHAPMEYAISTKPVRGQFKSLPPSYKVDLAVPRARIAIEVDGHSHKTKKWKFLDRRKTSVLNALGWSVLRFWNHEVLKDPQAVMDRINRSIASKSKETTTSSQRVRLSRTASRTSTGSRR